LTEALRDEHIRVHNQDLALLKTLRLPEEHDDNKEEAKESDYQFKDLE